MKTTAAEPAEEPAAGYATWLAQAFDENPDQILNLDPFDETILLINPARNSRGSTPEIGDKSLTALIEDIETIGQTTPCFATLEPEGYANLYAGFRRARAIQTLEKAAIASGNSNAWKLRVTVTDHILTPQELFERSLSENVFREDMTIMQKIAALKQLTGGEPGFGLSMSQAAKKMNMAKSAASVFLRMDMFPAVAKKALHTGKLTYKGAEGLIAVLPSAADMEKEPEETRGELLARAQHKIAVAVEKMLAKSGKVTGAAVDQATRKMSDSTGKAANTKQRTARLVVAELDEQLALAKEKEDDELLQAAAPLLAAFRKYVQGGSLKSLLKALGTGE